MKKQTYDFQGDCVEIDVFNPETRKYVWDVCKKKYYDIRIEMHDYIKKLYDEASENGSPLICAMFYEFNRDVYLPAGTWEDTRDGKVYEGGQTIHADAPIDSIPVFKRK